MLAALDRGYADPRRLHSPARDARLLLDNAREAVAEALGVRRDEVSFTSSGTDAVHRGLLGMVVPRRESWRTRPSSTRRCCTPWPGGPDVEVRSGARRPPTAACPSTIVGDPDVVALQQANHEVGHGPARRRTPRPVAPVFMDACASMGRLPLPTAGRSPPGRPTSGAARPASGSCWSARAAAWRNPFPADDRVDERASGFENVPAALAAAAALQAVVAERDEVSTRQHALVDRIRAAAATIPDTEVVGDPRRAAPPPRDVLLPLRRRRGARRRPQPPRLLRSRAGRPAPPRPWSPATCWRRWARSPTATSGSR